MNKANSSTLTHSVVNCLDLFIETKDENKHDDSGVPENAVPPDDTVAEEIPYQPPGRLKGALRLVLAFLFLLFMFLFLDYVFGFMKGN